MKLLMGLMVVILLSGCATTGHNWTMNNTSVTEPKEESIKTGKGYTTLETIGLVVGLVLVWGGVFYLLSTK